MITAHEAMWAVIEVAFGFASSASRIDGMAAPFVFICLLTAYMTGMAFSGAELHDLSEAAAAFSVGGLLYLIIRNHRQNRRSKRKQ